MNSCDEFIEKVKRELPDICSTKDLIKMGLFKSEHQAWHARKKGTSFDFFKLPQGTIGYPKTGIIQTLESSKHVRKSL